MGLAGLAAFGLLYATQPLLPALSRSFTVDPTTASLSVSVSTGALAVLVMPATRLAARAGRGRTIGAGLVAAVLLTLAAAAAPNFGTLLAARALTGAALAAVVGVAMGHVAAEVQPHGLAAAMGMYVAGNSLGGVTGRLIGSFVLDLSTWRWALLVLALFSLVMTAGFVRLVPASVQYAPAEPTVAAQRDQRFPSAALMALLALPLLLMGGFVAIYNFLTYRLTSSPFDLPSAAVGALFLTYLAGTAASALSGRGAGR
jgi:YNFM family putative membrane transporter